MFNLTEAQFELLIEALVPPELKGALDTEGVSHLVDRHDAMYLAHRNTQYHGPDDENDLTKGQHEWRITVLAKGIPHPKTGAIQDKVPDYHFSFKDPAVLASSMKKIHSAPEHWSVDDVHDMLRSHNGGPGRRGGFGEKLYPKDNSLPLFPDIDKENADIKEGMGWLANFEDNMKPYEKKTESTVYEDTVRKMVDELLEDMHVYLPERLTVNTAIGKAPDFVNELTPHMDIHKRNKIAAVMVGSTGVTV